MLKQTFVLCIALVMAFSAKVCAESGFVYSASSTTLVGGLTGNLGTVQILNSNIQLSTTSGTASIIFEDGTSIESANKVLGVSSAAIVSNYSTTLVSGYQCITGSTVTITTVYPRSFFITFDGTMTNTAKTSNHFSPVINGAAPAMPGGLNNFKSVDTTATGATFSPALMFTTGLMPPGTYTFCVAAWGHHRNPFNLGGVSLSIQRKGALV